MVEHLRLIHFADLHLGVEAGGRAHPETGLNQRIHDVCDRLDELCEVAEADQVHAVLFAGDAFKNQRPAPTLQALFARRVRRLARSGSAVFLLIGNHDLPKMAAQAHPFSIYDELEIEGVVVGDRAQIYELPLKDAPVGSMQVAALPHFSRHQALEYLRQENVEDPDDRIAELITEKLSALRAGLDPQRPAVFVGHCHVEQADVGSTRDLYGVSDVEVSISTLLSGSPFPYHALGHLHKQQVLAEEPFAAYSGSLERVDFGEGERVDVAANGKVARREAEAKGFYRFDLVRDGATWRLGGSPEFRHVRAREFVTLRVGRLGPDDPLTDLETRLAAVRSGGVHLADAFVKITGRIQAADRQRVTRTAVRTLVGEAHDVRLVLEADEDEAAVRDPRFAEPMPEREALTKYLETRDDWADERDEVLRLGRELIDEVLG